MEVRYYKWYSYNLNRDMEYKVYGEQGIPFFYFPTQYQRFYEAENRGIIHELSKYIEEGKLFVIAVDSIDSESLSNTTYWDKRKRLELQEAYHNYFTNELYEVIKKDYNPYSLPVLFGMSFGAYQAMNFFIRRPMLYKGVFALSGIYNIRFFINDYYDDLSYLNSPIDQIRLMNNDYYLDIYRHKKIVMVVSSGAYEESSINDTYDLQQSFLHREILNVEAYYWTSNYPHDWSSWKTYLNFYIRDFLY